MTKMLKFTNLNRDRLDMPIYINKDQIVSVFEEATDGGSLSTIIYGGPKGERWHVEESLSEVIKKINEE
jgi:hypothetical protein